MTCRSDSDAASGDENDAAQHNLAQKRSNEEDNSDIEMDENTAVIIKPERGPLAPAENLQQAAPAQQHAAAEPASPAAPAAIKPDPGEDNDGDGEAVSYDTDMADEAAQLQDDAANEAPLVKPDPGLPVVDPMDAEIAAEEAAAAAAAAGAPQAQAAAGIVKEDEDSDGDMDEDDAQADLDDVPDPDDEAVPPGTQAPAAQALAPMADVQLPDGEEAQQAYMQKAFAGMSNMLSDAKIIAKSVFNQIKPSTLCASLCLALMRHSRSCTHASL